MRISVNATEARTFAANNNKGPQCPPISPLSDHFFCGSSPLDCQEQRRQPNGGGFSLLFHGLYICGDVVHVANSKKEIQT